MCYGERFRIYWRVSEQEYIPIYNFIGVKAGLNMMYTPRIYVVADESAYWSQFSRGLLIDVLEKYHSVSDHDECGADFDSFLEKLETSSNYALSDIEVLKCALTEKPPSDDPAVRFDYLLAKTPTMYTNETKNVDRQLKLLMKGFPEKKSKPLIEQFPKLKNSPSRSNTATSKKKGPKK
ncbi:hypothetical protein KPH14_004555 [Odynerus spinipes]|uniref:Uncharacterized protein n=1 Tax=Odynerus spinipes TaxID=1348599 RepID=A0AAD9RLZ5_9HYME|nr:hypothetical protein KPH14_004555 [Odynerus spinipes]